MTESRLHALALTATAELIANLMLTARGLADAQFPLKELA